MNFAITVVFLVGFIAAVAFFIKAILKSIGNEKKLKKLLLEPKGVCNIPKEPFEGSLYFCAIVTSNFDLAILAEKQIRNTLENYPLFDWGIFCRTAEACRKKLNIHLLVECFANILKRNNAPQDLLKKIFFCLKNSETNWKNESGIKPSDYLAELLKYHQQDNNVAECYKILGLKKKATKNQVKKAYHKLASVYHPDKGGKIEAFQQIQKAYEIIIKQF